MTRAAACTDVRLPKLRIHFLEVLASDEYFTRLAPGCGGNESFRLHHVDQARGTAETDSHLALQVRDRSLAGRHHDARGLVIQLVLLEFETGRSVLLIFFGDRLVVDRLALLAQEAGQPRRFLLGDVGAVQANVAG